MLDGGRWRKGVAGTKSDNCVNYCMFGRPLDKAAFQRSVRESELLAGAMERVLEGK
jgi:hypothetical protein